MRLYGILRAVNRNVTNHGLSVGKLMALRLVTQKPPTFFMEHEPPTFLRARLVFSRLSAILNGLTINPNGFTRSRAAINVRRAVTVAKQQ